jgi:hypothetical protein
MRSLTLGSDGRHAAQFDGRIVHQVRTLRITDEREELVRTCCCLTRNVVIYVGNAYGFGVAGEAGRVLRVLVQMLELSRMGHTLTA